MTATVVRLRDVGNDVGWTDRIDEQLLERKLGRAATQVWAVMCALRDLRHEVHITVNGLARARGWTPLHPRVVKKALARLRTAGLVCDIGWQLRSVPWRHTYRMRRVYVRRVHGERLRKHARLRTYGDYEHHDFGWEYAVPKATTMWLETACHKGGKRPGAGRPVTMRNRDEKNQKGPWSKESKGSTDPNTDLDPLMDVCPNSVRASAPRSAVSIAGVGVVLGSPAKTAPFTLAAGIDGVPPYPDITVLMPARIPPPPLLNEHDSDDANVARLLHCYCVAVERRIGKRPFVRAGRFRKRLVAVAQLLIEHSIPPAAWALFMCDVHKHYVKEKRKKRPDLGWVYSPAKVKQWRGWYGSEAATYSGGRLVFGKRHLALLARYERMRRDLHTSGDAPADVVARWFPSDNTFAQQLAAAREEAASLQERYELRVANWEVLW